MAASSAVYSLDLIRTLSKDVDAKAVGCTAKVNLTVRDWVSIDFQTYYMRQYTSKGDLYVEVAGF